MHKPETLARIGRQAGGWEYGERKRADRRETALSFINQKKIRGDCMCDNLFDYLAVRRWRPENSRVLREADAGKEEQKEAGQQERISVRNPVPQPIS